jgi:hypothetical protein
MRRLIATMVALGLAAALMVPGGAAAKPAPAPSLTLEILDHAKLDKRTGVAYVRTAIRCSGFPAGHQVVTAELSGLQTSPVLSPGYGGLLGGRSLVCDGRKRIYTSSGFAPEPGEPAWSKGELSVSAILVVDSADGAFGLTASDSETIRLR